MCTLGVPALARDLSPFTHVPAVPVDVGPIVGLLAVLGGCALAGLVGLRRRDLHLPA